MSAEQVTVCRDPIFVIGSGRSGTSILAWSLARHSQLFNLNETTIINDLFGNEKAVQAYRKSAERPGPTMVQSLGVTLDDFLASLGLGINALFTSKSEGKRWIDKTPQHTLMGDLLVKMFPGARFVHILRDGRRVVNSMINFHNAPIRESQREKFGPIPPWDFKNACQTWSRYVEAALAFCARHPTRCLTVINEELIANPGTGFRGILDFIDVPYEDGPAEYFGSHQLNSSFWESGPLDAPLDSRFSDPWNTWSSQQHDIFQQEAGVTQAKYSRTKDLAL
jgi:hypothetical protein